MNRENPEEAGPGEKKTQGEVTGQGRTRLPKMVQSAERGKGRDERVVVVRIPCQEKNPLQMHTPTRTSQCWSRQTQHGIGVCIWMHLVNGKGSSPSLGQLTLE